MARQLHDEAPFEVKESDLQGIDEVDKDTVYTLRPLTTQKFRELQKKNTKNVLNKRAGRMEPQLDGETLADDLIDHVIADWRGILSKGQPAECSRDNKLRLDGQVKQALIGVAGLNRIEAMPEEREQSKSGSSAVL